MAQPGFLHRFQVAGDTVTGLVAVHEIPVHTGTGLIGWRGELAGQIVSGGGGGARAVQREQGESEGMEMAHRFPENTMDARMFIWGAPVIRNGGEIGVK